MQTVYAERHKLRSSKIELYGGQFLPPFECRIRAQHILGRVREICLGEILASDAFGLIPGLRSHRAAFVTFLETCWADWQADGFKGGAIATAWPSRAIPRTLPLRIIEGLSGYYALAADTSICGDTWEAACASADVALTGQRSVAAGARSAFALCRPPGHHAASDIFGGYCFLDNAVIAARGGPQSRMSTSAAAAPGSRSWVRRPSSSRRVAMRWPMSASIP